MTPPLTPASRKPTLLIHPLRLQPHPLHPPSNQLLILDLELPRPLLGHIERQVQPDHLVLHLLDQTIFSAQLGVAVAEAALEVALFFLQGRDAGRSGAVC